MKKLTFDMEQFQKGLIGDYDRTTAGTEIDGDGTVARVKDSGQVNTVSVNAQWSKTEMQEVNK